MKHLMAVEVKPLLTSSAWERQKLKWCYGLMGHHPDIYLGGKNETLNAALSNTKKLLHRKKPILSTLVFRISDVVKDMMEFRVSFKFINKAQLFDLSVKLFH